MAMQTPEKQVLPIAPITSDTLTLSRWAGDLTRTLQQNLATIARKANDGSSFVPIADLNMLGFDIINVTDLQAATATFSGAVAVASLTVGGTPVVPGNYQPIDGDLTSWAGVTRAAGFDTFVATPSSANLASLITDETGTGTVVFSISPALTGTPTAPTAAGGTNTTQIATTAFVTSAVAALPTPSFTEAFQSSGQTITSAGSLTIAHGLSATPDLIALVLECTTADAGYSVGNRIHYGPGISDTSNNFGIAVWADATNLNLRFGSAAQPIRTIDGTTGARVSLTNASWSLLVRAWA